MAKDSLSELKFKIYQRIPMLNMILGTIEQLLTVLHVCPLNFEKFQLFEVPFIFFAKVAHTENEFGIQIYHQIIQTKLGFGTIDQSSIFERVMSLKLRKSSFI